MIMAPKRVDANQIGIVQALRAYGCSVTVLSSVGGGFPDLICGYRQKNILFECKNLEGRGDRLTPAEEAWIRSWRGQIAIIFNVEQALAVIEDAVYEDAADESK
jgi:hypothetical protein